MVSVVRRPALVLVAAASALLGCAHDKPPAQSPPTSSITQTTSHVVAAPAPQSLHVSNDILKACKLDLDNVDTAPKFDFDNSDLRSDERAILQQVATCVTRGPLKGRSLKLVGRADPRGEVEYNFVLGESRAGSVQTYLTGLGVARANVTTTSRGKLDANGTDDASWQRDRRVDIDLL